MPDGMLTFPTRRSCAPVSLPSASLLASLQALALALPLSVASQGFPVNAFAFFWKRDYLHFAPFTLHAEQKALGGQRSTALHWESPVPRVVPDLLDTDLSAYGKAHHHSPGRGI